MSRTYTQKTRKSPARRGREKGLLKLAANAKKKLPATVTEEHDWSNDVPSIKLATAFFVILALHVALVAGVIVFKRFGGVVEEGSKVVAPAVAAAPAAAASATAAAPQDYAGYIPHTVRDFETLEEIAGEFGTTREAIEKFNRIGVDNPVHTGMRLLIPPREIRAVAPQAEPMVAEVAPEVTQPQVRRAEPVASQRTTQTRPAATSASSHTVSKGETLWAISQRYGVTADQIMTANGIKNARSLRVGAVLKIPKG